MIMISFLFRCIYGIGIETLSAPSGLLICQFYIMHALETCYFSNVYIYSALFKVLESYWILPKYLALTFFRLNKMTDIKFMPT